MRHTQVDSTMLCLPSYNLITMAKITILFTQTLWNYEDIDVTAGKAIILSIQNFYKAEYVGSSPSLERNFPCKNTMNTIP